MKDLSARLKIAVVLLVLAVMPGCQLFQKAQANEQSQNLQTSSSTLNFGSVVIGSNKTMPLTLMNNTSSSITVSEAVVTGNGFSLNDPALPVVIAAGQSVDFNFKFAPLSPGQVTGSVTITDDASDEIVLGLSARGDTAGQLSVNPTSIAFGNVLVGESLTKSEIFTNSGGSDLTVSQVSVSGLGYQLSGLSLPLTLSVGQSTTFSVIFAPAGAGTVNGTITVSSMNASGIRKSQSNAKNPQGKAKAQDDTQTVTIPLSGTGFTQGQLTATPTSLNFGNIQVGNNQSLDEILTNTGGSTVTISAATVTGAGYTVSGLTLPLSLAAGQSATFSAKFAPTTAGSVNGNILIVSDASNSPFNIPLSGTGVAPGQLSAAPTSLAFGSVQVSKNMTLSETLTNAGGSTVTITQATITGTGFTLSGLSLPVTLTSGQSKTFNVTFAPTSAGAVSGNIAVISNASNTTLNIPLSGTGVTAGSLTSTPSSLSFGSITVGKNSTLSETLTNSGGSNVTITQAAVTGTGFTLSGLTLPLTLTAGQTKTFSVVFAPTSAGTVSGNIAVISDASNTTLNIPLSGTGVAAGSLTATPSSLSFGSVTVGKNSTLSETLTNTGGAAVTISQATVAGAGLSLSGLTLPVTLPAGQTKTFSVVFAPVSAGAVSGNLAVISNASNTTLNIPLSGTGVAAGSLTATPSSLSFGSVTVGKNSTLSETLTNTGGTTVTISQATVTGGGFSLSGLTLPVTLPAGQTKTFSAIFAPVSAGAVSGNIAIVSDGSNPTLNISLSGTGVTAGSLTATPSSLSFGNITVGKNSTLSETLTNTGGTTVTISQATVTGAGFSLSGLTLPVTLTAGQTKTFSVIFAPVSAGAVSGNIAIVSDGSNPTLNISLSGTGVTAGSLTATPSSLGFGNVTVGSNSTLSETLTNTGGSTVTISQATVTGTGFSLSGLSLPVTLTAGQTKTFSVIFAPGAAGAASGNIAVISDASNSTLNIGLSGTGVTAGFLSANPSSVSFGNVQVGSNKTVSETLTNTGGTTVTITAANVTGTGFSISGLSLPLTLIAGQSFTFGAVFTPASAGSFSGSISVVSNASNSPLAISMTGTGTQSGQLGVTPSSLSFGNVNVGSSKSMTGTLTATGANVTVSSASVNTSEFAISGLSFPVTITAGQSKTFTVTFTPQASGAASDSATFVSDATNSPAVQALSGTGVAAPQHSVDLTWNASNSSDVVGYNIYRGSKTGGPYTKINTSLDPSTLYTDSTVQSGQTYFYVSTAVDSGGAESSNSNEVQATIPTP